MSASLARWLPAALIGSATIIASYACSTEETAADGLCVPGENIFCRCPGGQAGTKKCRGDGNSFDDCVLGPSTPCSDRPSSSGSNGQGGSTQVCNPGESIYCTCSAEQDGTKTCNHDGTAYGECFCDAGSGGNGGSGGGGDVGNCCAPQTAGGCSAPGVSACVCAQDSYCCDTEWDATCVSEVDQLGCGKCGGGGTKPLFAPCAAGGECQSGQCPMGYCTTTGCTGYADCGGLGVGECVSISGQPTCLPVCSLQSDCTQYGCGQTVCSECGYAEEVQIAWGVTVCADWGGALALPPDGTPCQNDQTCNLGHQGKSRVCHLVQEVCTDGCHVHDDCPGALICDDNAEPGTCW